MAKLTDQERQAQAEEMRVQRAKGWTDQQLADHHGVSLDTVRRRLAGDPRKRPARPGQYVSSEAETAEMWRMWVEGATQRRIGEHYGISPQAVSERLRRYQQNLPEMPRETIFQRELELLEEMRGKLVEVAIAPPPPLFSNGFPVLDVDGNQVPDYSQQINAARSVLATQDRLAKFLGLDAPAKTEVAVVEQATEAAKAAAERARTYLEGGGDDSAG